MRIVKRMRFIFFWTACLWLLGGCGAVSAQEAAGEAPKETVTVTETVDPALEDGPFLVTVTDQDAIYVEVQKDFYDPSTADNSFTADFLNKDGDRAVHMHISSGGENDSQCQIAYGEIGDTSTSAVSDYHYDEIGDNRIRYTILLNQPGVTIAGGDNLSIPLSVFEELVSCLYLTKDDLYEEIPAERVLKLDVDYALAEAKEEGVKKLEELLFRNETDREFLSPEEEDYRVEIYDAEATIYEESRVTENERGVYIFGTEPEGLTKTKPCKVYRVTEYDERGRLASFREKTEFENESDALHIRATWLHGDYELNFLLTTGENAVPTGFTDESGLKEICDEILPEEFAASRGGEQFSTRIMRDENAYYSIFIPSEPGLFEEAFYVDLGQETLTGVSISADEVEIGADHADDEGYVYWSNGNGNVTVFYSKPDVHRHMISYGKSDAGNNTTRSSMPEDFAVMTTDSKYFAPTTDDYILLYTPLEEFDSYRYTEYAVLISFDENGIIENAKYRRFHPPNLVNPMSELIEWTLQGEGSSLLYDEDTVAYFDITDTPDLESDSGGNGVQRLAKSELLKKCTGETGIWMPLYGESPDVAMYVSKR